MKPHPRIKRTVKWGGVAMCLGLGFLVTLATAWGRPIYKGIILKSKGDVRMLILELMAEGGEEPLDDSQRRELIRMQEHFWESWCSIRGRPLESGPPSGPSPYFRVGTAPHWAMHPQGFSGLAQKKDDVVEVHTRAYGLPWRCGRSLWASVLDATPPRSRSVGWDPFKFPSACLPTSPCWAGLAADVVVWSLPFYVVFFGAAAMRRARRRRRGRCVQCNYDRTGLVPGTVCPECSTAPATV